MVRSKTAIKCLILKQFKAGIDFLMHNPGLIPPELTNHGMVPVLTKLFQELAKFTVKNIVLFNKTEFNDWLVSLTEITIYRITQETVNNAIKYAESTHNYYNFS